MSDQFVEAAQEQMGAIERLLKGLPGISGYVDKEMRRDADYRVRQMTYTELEKQKSVLLDIQNKLLKGGGLAWLDDVDVAVGKLQTLADRVRTASYGYSGLFSSVRIREDELNALHRFDVALMSEVAKVETAVTQLRNSLGDKNAIGGLIEQVIDTVVALTMLFDRRERAILSPELLADASFVPAVESAEPLA